MKTRVAQLAAIAAVSLGLALVVTVTRVDTRTELMLQPVQMHPVKQAAASTAPHGSWFDRHMGAAAKRQFMHQDKTSLQLLNPGELSGELKDPDDPWGYSHPRCRGLPTCSDSTSSPAIAEHQKVLQKQVKVRKTGLLLNPGELAGELKDPDDPWGYSHPRCRGLPTCSDSTSSPAVAEHQQHMRKQIKTQSMKTVDKGMAALGKNLSPAQQYAYITSHQGFFSPWSDSRSWLSTLSRANLEKSLTPQALAAKAEMIKKEDVKFARKFNRAKTSQYTGVHTKISEILDPKYQPWANDGSRKAYYQGY
eukprot:CAMPEP_0181307592 /NCGR_PEP_ID=MMETSP1101-20121128/10972_1 /TAXON_ID=46948 /ORGANISM="Rhodomonas abbreviata, Strain Caron Lab Isolate" /LENGTH=306 /DNA_ID=CAMNT_0023413839 /DNA_START=10 /DNA_END=930 /DNA_ORIENTATION=+